MSDNYFLKNLTASELCDWCIEHYDLFAEESERLMMSNPDRIVLFNIAKLADRTKINEAREALSRIGSGFIEEGEVVKTHGFSTSVRDLLIKAHRSGTSFEVATTDKRMIQELERQGVMTISEADYQKVFVGAERVSESFFINCAGTRRVSLESPELYVVADTLKFAPGNLRAFTSRQHQLTAQSFLNVILENPYFEVVPLALARGIICEKGVLRPDEVNEVIRDAGA